MGTAQDLISRSLRTLGAVASGETPTAQESTDALDVLNDLLESWRLDSLLVYAIDRQVFAHTANTASYTIGSGGTWNVTRPVRIERAFFQDTTVSPALELPYHLLTDDEYEQLRIKGVTSSWPLSLYYDQAYPLGNVVLWPVPSTNNNTILYLWHVLGPIASLATTVDMPPGYRRALVYNLALELAVIPEYSTQGATAGLAKLAQESKAALQDINAETPILSLDEAITGPAGSGWNIYSDSSNYRA